jgi:hypothetical protein
MFRDMMILLIIVLVGGYFLGIGVNMLGLFGQ